MNIHQPSAAMKIVTKCERVQPTNVGLNKKGELIWEARAMPRWQREMFKRVIGWKELVEDWFMTQWTEVRKHELNGEEFKQEDSMLPLSVTGKSKKAIEDRKLQYQKSKRWRNVVIGD